MRKRAPLLALGLVLLLDFWLAFEQAGWQGALVLGAVFATVFLLAVGYAWASSQDV